MRYLVTRTIPKGPVLEIATFLNRQYAERYAEQESGLSGWIYMVEELHERRRLLSTFDDGLKSKEGCGLT